MFLHGQAGCIWNMDASFFAISLSGPSFSKSQGDPTDGLILTTWITDERHGPMSFH